jgi:hypothetical protein
MCTVTVTRGLQGVAIRSGANADLFHCQFNSRRNYFFLAIFTVFSCVNSDVYSFQKTPPIERTFRVASVLELVEEVIFTHFGGRRYAISTDRQPKRFCGLQDFNSIKNIHSEEEYKKFQETCLVARGNYSPTLTWTVADLANENCLELSRILISILDMLKNKEFNSNEEHVSLTYGSKSIKFPHVQVRFLLAANLITSCSDSGDLVMRSQFKLQLR